MTFIDWSDPEEMFGLLIEYIADERSETEVLKRRRFLSHLLGSLSDLQEHFGTLAPAKRIESLRQLHRTVDQEFENDPVVEHLEACAEELERINESDA